MAFFEKIKNGLKKTRDSLTSSINTVLAGFGKVDEELFEELEEVLIMGDLGIDTTEKIITELRKRVADNRVTDPEEVKSLLSDVISDLLVQPEKSFFDVDPSKSMKIIVVIGVNGVGKTTTIGKIASKFGENGNKVLLAAADTFRAAAIEQLEIWADRADCDIVKHAEGSDPGAVVFDSIQAAKARGANVVICDTAGRLHNKKHLMDELAKIFRIIGKEAPDADVESILVLDATTGQNAVVQAEAFSEVGHLTGLALTKLDGTAKGGIVIRISSEMSIPVKLIGVGEQVDDLQEFNASDFAKALLDLQ